MKSTNRKARLRKPSRQDRTTDKTVQSITSVQKDGVVIQPPKNFVAHGKIKSMSDYKKLYSESVKNPEKFWASLANDLYWHKPFSNVVSWKAPYSKWFVGGKTNLAYNCLDRHLNTHRKNKAAIIFEGEQGDTRTVTYAQLHSKVCQFANTLISLGVKQKDTVGIYMGMNPEAVIAMLACARIGAMHNVVFGGFSAEALRERMNDSNAKLIITQDGTFRRGAAFNLKDTVDEALKKCPSVQKVVVLQRTMQEVKMKKGRDVFWVDAIKNQNEKHDAEWLSAEHPHFVLYTSGSTGKPKGIFHTLGGYMTWANFTAKNVFDLCDTDIYWCTADIGWITGHSYVAYGPLMNGATVFMYEGALNYPNPDRIWELIAKHKINILYTAPTAIRAFMRLGDDLPNKHDLSSLRLLGTVGEPINPEAWLWYYSVIGKKRCPVVDTWWQTETGGIMISSLPNLTPMKPGSATLPLPGIMAQVVKPNGTPCKADEGGLLVIQSPWSSMLRTVWGDNERFKNTYFGNFKEWYFTGDGARKDKDGYFWIMGRVDDVVNVSGHRLGTAEIESALVAHSCVAESAVVAIPDAIKGSSLIAFVTLKARFKANSELKEILRNHVAKEIGAIAKPDDVRFADALPKTRSGKIMRRLLREIATNGKISGDTTTLEDYSALEKLRQDEE